MERTFNRETHPVTLEKSKVLRAGARDFPGIGDFGDRTTLFDLFGSEGRPIGPLTLSDMPNEMTWLRNSRLPVADID